ncbi:YdcF family protein [Francisella adeliensis]|uniref:YdcF family protein n=1 Tax=Francisella adeliensis TaxID=2007306 RepID=A0A2Z4XYU0_9GAMM|nr:YdcF family protein [Francisella adeliensis]AXA33603.1 hypothetical protein CDH04_03895 [Francisella adeliensis]MBK2085154.1 YdcF family protein [Francisella adeliensis]MBK2097369.1 YdcF family protein [Francisella adeliensis]QIW11835.1 YdcF family protein [Francisella adeliensis]QIW13711.1 YdcF family protein [Francisella adeliensis]
MFKNKKLLLSICLTLPSFIFANDNSFNLKTLEQQQNAVANIQYNTNVSSSDENNGATTKRGDPADAMKSLASASEMSKDNLYLYNQLMMSLGNLQVLNNHIDQAKATFTKLGSINSNKNPILQVYLTAYSLLWNPVEYKNDLNILKASKWQKMPHYIKAIETAENSFDIKLNTSVDKLPKLDQNRLAIVVLGYALNDDGTTTDILTDRLKKVLDAYHNYPNAIIIVSGGAARNGTTESYQMKQWLIKHKVPSNKIIQEDQSISTVTNGLNTIEIFKKINRPIQDILLISSDSHTRRATAIFEQAIANSQMPIKVNNLVASTKQYDIDKPANKQEQALIIVDTLRTAGLWEMPGMVF